MYQRIQKIHVFLLVFRLNPTYSKKICISFKVEYFVMDEDFKLKKLCCPRPLLKSIKCKRIFHVNYNTTFFGEALLSIHIFSAACIILLKTISCVLYRCAIKLLYVHSRVASYWEIMMLKQKKKCICVALEYSLHR